MGIFVFLLIVVVVIIALVAMNNPSEEERDKARKQSQKYQEKIDTLIKESGINDRIYWSPHDYRSGATALSINEDDSTVIVLKIPSREDFLSERLSPKVRKIIFGDIVEAKVKSNSTTITSTSRGAQMGGALIGGALLGATGAVIGGLSGKKQSNETIRNLKLEIVVSSISNPVIEIPFSEPNVELKAETPEYDESTRIINDWYRKFTVILHQQDQKQA